MGKQYTGIDIGDHALKLAVSDGASIKSMVLETIPDGMVADGRIVSYDAMADFIKSVGSRHRGLDKNVAFVVPAGSCVTRRMQVPFMTEKELAINLPYEFRDYITQGKDKYVYDYSVLSLEKDAEGKPTNMNLLAVACSKETLRDYTEMFKRAGFRLRVALPPLAALQNVLTNCPAALANCCVIDFSHGGTKLHFFAEGIYDVTRTIDMGGIDITRAIARHFGVDEHMADEYKQSNFNNAQRIEEVKQVYESIDIEAGRALSFFGFNNPQVVLQGVYYYGGGAQLPALLQALAAHLEIPLIGIDQVMPPQAGPHDYRLLCALAFGATIGR